MPRKKDKETGTENTFLKPFLVGVFLFSIICIPVSVGIALTFPLGRYLTFLSAPLTGYWVVYGFVFGLFLTLIGAFFFARSIRPAKTE